ncbi:MAG TPA: PQQ-binding-like beta-propeller repeat protein [Flavobacteriales bacterium]|nr:PQQ-binding-like beta-propeller repeat protein [Flavobacteriales bacterium]
MKPIAVITIFFFVFAGKTQAQLMAKTFPHTSSQTVSAHAPVSDGGHLVLLTGDGNVLLRTDSDFNTLWAKKLGSDFVGLTWASALTELTDHGFLLFYHGGVIAKFDENGNPLWRNSYLPGAGGYAAPQCIEKPDGKFIAFLSYYDSFQVIQFSSDGNFEWSRTIGSPETDPMMGGKNPGFDVLPLADGSIVCSGKAESDNCFVRIDANGNMLWSVSHNIASSYNHPKTITVRDDGNILVAGSRPLAASQGFYMTLSVVDGSILWQKTVSEFVFTDAVAIGGDQYMLLAKDSDGDIFDYDQPDLILTLINGSGEVVKSKRLAGITCYANAPVFTKLGSQRFVNTSTNPGTSEGGFSLLELNSVMDFPCRATDQYIAKEAYTIPPTTGTAMLIGDLSTTEIGPGPLSFSVTDVSLSVDVKDFCYIFPPSVEIEPGNPFPTTGSGTLNEGEMGTSVTENMAQPKMLTYPNPAMQGQPITVSFDRVINGHISLTDLSGKTILQAPFSGNAYSFSTGNLAQGMYLLYCKSADGISQTVKINVE